MALPLIPLIIAGARVAAPHIIRSMAKSGAKKAAKAVGKAATSKAAKVAGAGTLAAAAPFMASSTASAPDVATGQRMASQGGGGDAPATIDASGDINDTIGGGPGGSGAGGSGAGALDLSELASLDAMIRGYDTNLANAIQQATLTRDASLKEKKEELDRERGKFDSKSLSNLQEFGDALTGTDMNTRDTLSGLVSSLSTMGLGGGAELQRQILSAANRANRQANTTQATNARDLTQAFNEYSAGNENDVKKINDQFGFNEAQARKTHAENRQAALHKKANVYRDAGQEAQRTALMREADNLTSLIGNSTFLNPEYTGETKTMATPELSDFSQDIGSYNTTGLAGQEMAGGTGANAPAIRAVPLNEQDLGIKKKREGELGYGL